MRKFILAATTVLLIGSLGAPAYADSPFGALIGAGLGGFLGNQIGGRGSFVGRGAATVAGVIFGGLIGNEVGSSWDFPSDSSYGGSSAYYPGPVYYQTNYEPNYVAPPAPPPAVLAAAYYVANAQCRSFNRLISAGDEVIERHGTACLQPDGMWHVVEYE